jgi:hypothetical protein
LYKGKFLKNQLEGRLWKIFHESSSWQNREAFHRSPKQDPQNFGFFFFLKKKKEKKRKKERKKRKERPEKKKET